MVDHKAVCIQMYLNNQIYSVTDVRFVCFSPLDIIPVICVIMI